MFSLSSGPSAAASSQVFSTTQQHETGEFTYMDFKWEELILGPNCSLKDDHRVFYNHFTGYRHKHNDQALVPYKFVGTRGKVSVNGEAKECWRVQVIRSSGQSGEGAARMCVVGIATDYALRSVKPEETLPCFGMRSFTVGLGVDWTNGVLNMWAKRGKDYLAELSEQRIISPEERIATTLWFLFNGPKSVLYVTMETKDDIEILWKEKWTFDEDFWPFVCAAEYQSCGEMVEVILCSESEAQLSTPKMEKLSAIFKGEI